MRFLDGSRSANVTPAPTMPSRHRALLSALVLLTPAVHAQTPAAGALAAPPGGLPTITARTTGLLKREGLLPLYWDERTGKLYLEIPQLDRELIYATSLPWGVGSNDIGLDRSQVGNERLVTFTRVGPRVLLIEKNTRYRAVTRDSAEAATVEQSFARSALFGFTVEAQEGGRVLVDATDFTLRDAHDAAETLRRSQQGTYAVDRARSAVHLPNTKGFPRNTEIEATLTLAGQNPGRFVQQVTPRPDAITIRERQSFIALPEAGYTMRAADPRSGFFGISYQDYAQPIGGPFVQRWIGRHRLIKKTPGAAMSEAVEPIVYYVDNGAPEPIRTALVDGARWWNQAFEAAGFRDAFRVEVRPDSIDPMDVRYNVIQWVHRATRGWSYGASISDPRTGEILKGHVVLGSLRARQDWLIAEGLLAPYVNGDERPAAVEQMMLARIRQLSAHEVGHTLGMAHNYISSAQGRASVMDYPHPLVTLDGSGRVSLDSAYTNEIGAWDKVAVTWGYGEFGSGAGEARALDSVLVAARNRGLTMLTDQDARPTSSAHPEVHLWDNGTDAAAELRRVMTVRRAALAAFGERTIRRGAPMATLEEVFVPLYLHHRYQLEAAVKVVGGVRYEYTMRGDGRPGPTAVPMPQQMAALDAVLDVLNPRELAVPRSVLAQVPPRPFLIDGTRELFDRWTGMTFDPLSPGATIAGVVFDVLLDEERAARLVAQQAVTASLPGFTTVLNRVSDALFLSASADGYHEELARLTKRAYAERLMMLIGSAQMPSVRAEARAALQDVASRLARTPAGAPAVARAAAAGLRADIAAFFDGRYEPTKRPPRLTVPPGSPIGDTEP
jgi:hypothetical protein